MCDPPTKALKIMRKKLSAPFATKCSFFRDKAVARNHETSFKDARSRLIFDDQIVYSKKYLINNPKSNCFSCFPVTLRYDKHILDST